MFDTKRTGYVTVEDLKALSQDVEEHISADDLRDMVREADSDGDGRVSMEDFVRVMLQTNIFR